MRIYIRNYLYRLSEILITVISALMMFVLLGIIFQGSFNKINQQLHSYDNADYNYIYILSYYAPVDDSFLYPDTSIQLFTSSNERIAVTCLMQDANVSYTMPQFPVDDLTDSGSVVISRNVAEKYHINIGETIQAEVPYSSERKSIVVRNISDTEYDISNPNIDNGIGVAYLGYDEDYRENIDSKYICFSEQSKAGILSEYPQIISTVINKSENYSQVFNQGIYVLIFEIIFTSMLIAVGEYFFFSKSFGYIRRIVLKGNTRKLIVNISVFEKLLFLMLPAAIALLTDMLLIPVVSKLAGLFYVIPIGIIVMYIFVSAIIAKVKYR